MTLNPYRKRHAIMSSQDDALQADLPHEDLTYGKPIMAWETLEYPKHERSLFWYIMAGIVGGLLLIYALLTASFPFAVIILMIGVVFLLSHMRDPARMRVSVTSNGLIVGPRFYPYREVKDFSIVYEPPAVRILYVDFVSVWQPVLSVSLEDEDPNRVREALIPFVFENLQRDQESLTDTLARVYKL
jgi:hypothetical protein